MKHLFQALILLMSLWMHASGQDYFFRQYANIEGLDHTYIYAVNQGQNGFLWIGTEEGLYKFNGVYFQQFTTEDGLADNLTTVLFTDSRGILWAGHQNGSLTRMSENGFDRLNENANPGGSVTDITEDENGSIWITVQNLGLLCIDRQGGITKVHFPRDETRLTQIASLGKGLFLTGSQENLYLCKFESASGSMVDLKRVDRFPISKVAGILQESDSSHIIISETHGVYRFQRSQFHEAPELTIIDNNVDGHLDNLQGGLLDAGGCLWLHTLGHGMIRYDPDPGGIYGKKKLFSSKNGLASDNVRSLFEDAEGNLWLGMYGEGLLKFTKEKLRFYKYENEEGNLQVHAITNKDGHLIIIAGKRLLEISASGDSVYNSYSIPGISSEDKVNAAFVSENGKLWLGLEKSGLYVADTQEFKFRSVRISQDDLANSVNHIAGTEKYLWVSTKKGICRIDLSQHNPLWITSENGLPHNNIQQLYIDSKGRVLVATLCRELYYINDQAEVAVLENSRMGPQNLLASILEGPDGSIWAGTEGNGIWKIGQNEIILYNRSSGLYSDYCYSLALTRDEELVIGHRGGLSVIAAESKRIKIYERLSGISSAAVFYSNAVHPDKTGNLWFGTSEGLICFATGSTAGEEMAPRIHIEGVFLNGEKIEHTAGLIVQKPGQYELRVDFIGLHFSNPEMVAYQTRLEGFSRDWSEPSVNRQVVYERIEHGHYSFHLRAFNENDILSEASSLFEIRINKPVYLRIWFYGILVLVLASGFYTIIRIRERNHRMVQEGLLKNLDEKTKEIIVKEEIIKERKRVEKVLIEAKTKAEESERLKTSFLQNISHEIRTPMNAIVGFSQLLKEVGISTEDRDQYIKRVSDNADSLLKLVDNIIELSKLETNKLELKAESILVNSVMDEVEGFALDRLRKVSKEDIELIKVCPGENTHKIVTDYTRLKQVFTHLLDNAVKFTEQGSIKYGYQMEEHGIQFFVEDTGIGLSEDKIGVVFDLFRKVEGDRFKLYEGTGLGLTISGMLVNMMGGKIDVDSKPGFGSRFYFTIPDQASQVSDNIPKIQSDEIQPNS